MKTVSRNVGEVMAALAKRYAPPSWALLSQLGSGTGWARGRYADAVALGLWPSRGIDLHGFEVKVYRGDWLRELKRPEKADEIATFCDFWWLVVGHADIVDLDRDPIPTTWGVLELNGRGLVQRRPAERNPKPDVFDKPFVAAIFRRASEDMIPRSSIAAQLAAAREEGVEAGRAETSDSKAQREAADLKAAIASFEATSGVRIGAYSGAMTGLRFRAAERLDTARNHWALKSARDHLDASGKAMDAAMAALAECDPNLTGRDG